MLQKSKLIIIAVFIYIFNQKRYSMYIVGSPPHPLFERVASHLHHSPSHPPPEYVEVQKRVGDGVFVDRGSKGGRARQRGR
jgi:hypothetical protein